MKFDRKTICYFVHIAFALFCLHSLLAAACALLAIRSPGTFFPVPIVPGPDVKILENFPYISFSSFASLSDTSQDPQE